MSKRARYDGPGKVFVSLDEGDVNKFRPNEKDPKRANGVYVENGQLLPEETPAGDNIPAKIRDDLLNTPDWSEVKQSDSSAKGSDK